MRDLFIDRPKAAIVLAVVIVIIGVAAMLNLPVTQYPAISPPSVSVSANYIGADAQTVEEGVTTPIEVQINGVPGLKYLSSSSTNSGVSSIQATFDLGTDIDIAALEVQNRVSLAEPTLPEQVSRLGVTVSKQNPGLFMLVSLYSPNGTHDQEFLDNYTNVFVKDALLRVQGIGDASTLTSDFAMRLWLRPDLMAQLGMEPSEVIAALQEQNLQVAAGSVGQPPQRSDQAFEYTVFIDGRLETVEQFNDVIIRNDPATGSLIRLRDIGRAELGTFSYGTTPVVNGSTSSLLVLFQAPESNALASGKGVREAMTRLKAQFPPDVDYRIPFEAVSVVQVSIDEVITTLLIALGLVSLVVYIFLQRVKATLIPLLAIPVSIIGAFVMFIPLGFTINTITLFGFVLAIGIVVDDAIVVVEAIQEKMESDKMNAVDATRAAISDVGTPVITTSLVLIAIFLPVAFIPGLTGQLYKQFAVTISVSVALSSLVALSLSPALAVLLFEKDQKQPDWLQKLFGPFNRGLASTTRGYMKVMKWTLGNRVISFIIFVGFCAAAFLLFSIIPSAFIPTEDDGRVFITFELPEAASSDRTVEVMDEMIQILDSVPEIAYYTGVPGLNVVTFTNRSNTGTIFCQLLPWDERKGKNQGLFALVAELNERMQRIVDARVIVIPPPSIPGVGTSSGFSFILQDRTGTATVAEFEQVMQAFLGAINQREEIAGAYSFFTAQTPGYKMVVNRELAKQLGVPLTDIYNTIQTYLGSSYINDFALYGRTYRVVAQADTAFRGTIEEVDDYYVRNTEGTMVPLKTLVSYEVSQSAPLISHYNLFRSASISGNSAPGFSSGQALTALQEEAAKLPRGYGYEFSGLSEEEVASGNTTIYIFSLSIIFAFLILVALYESWTVPFAVLLAAPLGIFGALLVLYLAPGIDNNVYAQIGLITVIALAAKNAILIVEFAKQRVEEGEPIDKATQEAAQLRLRPILMTSMTFIFGMIPLVIASGAGANSRQTIGVTVVGGMLGVMLLATLAVPYFYAVITKWAYSEEELAQFAKNKPAS